jgi:hypothetical protein
MPVTLRGAAVAVAMWVGVGFVAGVDGTAALRTHDGRLSRAKQQARAHTELTAQDPCLPGMLKAFRPQLNCDQLSPPSEPIDLVVVTESTCKQVLTGISTKTAPYWDSEMQRCAAETRVGLLTQCAEKIGSNFSLALQVRARSAGLWSFCHKSACGVRALPPTGCTGSGGVAERSVFGGASVWRCEVGEEKG